MKQETIEKFIEQLDGMITTLQQTAVLGGWTRSEHEACKLLKDARLKLVEELENHETWNELARLHQHAENQRLLDLPGSKSDE